MRKRHAFRPEALESLEGRVVPTAVNDIVVATAYQTFLGRDPEPTGLGFWSGLLDRGVNRVQVVSAIQNSLEADVHFVRQTYQSFLGHDADPGALFYYVSGLTSGRLTSDLVRAKVLASNEFIASAGGTPQGFIEKAYQVVLGRPAGPAGVGFWGSLLATGWTPAQVGLGILTSPEALTNEITNDYRTLLNRNPEPSGFSFWFAQRQGEAVNEFALLGLYRGVGDAEDQRGMFAKFISSAEYYGRAAGRVIGDFVSGTSHSAADNARALQQNAFVAIGQYAPNSEFRVSSDQFQVKTTTLPFTAEQLSSTTNNVTPKSQSFTITNTGLSNRSFVFTTVIQSSDPVFGANRITVTGPNNMVLAQPGQAPTPVTLRPGEKLTLTVTVDATFLRPVDQLVGNPATYQAKIVFKDAQGNPITAQVLTGVNDLGRPVYTTQDVSVGVTLTFKPFTPVTLYGQLCLDPIFMDPDQCTNLGNLTQLGHPPNDFSNVVFKTQAELTDAEKQWHDHGFGHFVTQPAPNG